MSILVNVPRALVDWLIPETCLLCGQHSDGALCPGCEGDLPWLGTCCERCALPLATGRWCGQCLEQPPSFDTCVGAFRFAYPVDQLINRFKHRRQFRNGNTLALALSQRLHQHYRDRSLPEQVVPMPLHWRRAMTRGFNQAALIGQLGAKALGLSLQPILRRRLATPQQQGLDRKQRLRNLRDAFVIKEGTKIPRHVALVDDVMTTGATAEAASAALKKAGVQQIDVWVLARTPAPGDD